MRAQHPDGDCGRGDCLWCALTRAVGASHENYGAWKGMASSGLVSPEKVQDWLREIAAFAGMLLGALPAEITAAMLLEFGRRLVQAQRRSRELNMANPIWRAHVGIDEEHQA